MALIANSSRNIHIEAVPASARPQTMPLPTTRGEIGYVERAVDEERSSSPEPLPAHHPADRDHSDPTVVAGSSDIPAPSMLDNTLTPSNFALVLSESRDLMKKDVLCFFKRKNNLTFYGIRLKTLHNLLLLVILAGTLAGWVIVIKVTVHNPSNTSNITIIFIHVLFAFCVVSELLFLERRVYHLRAERYAYLHPGQSLPTSRNGRPVKRCVNTVESPYLPTYAAALAQRGTGTGDVEDYLTTIPPPPAYGNTRGSTLLLSGFLLNSLLARTSEQGRPRSSRQSQMSQRNDRAKSK